MKILGVIVCGYITWAIAHEINYYRKDRAKKRLKDINDALEDMKDSITDYNVFLKSCTAHRNGWGKEYVISSNYHSWASASTVENQTSYTLKNVSTTKGGCMDVIESTCKLWDKITWHTWAYPASTLRHCIRWLSGQSHDGYAPEEWGKSDG